MRELYLRLKGKRSAYFAAYTALFCIAAILTLGYFFLYHKSFIWNHDGVKQHYNGLLYYSRYLKSVLASLFGGGPMPGKWDFSIGYGSDVITTLHYYAVGDPLTLLSAFVPVSLMEFFYCFLFTLRSYIGGLGFSAYSLHHGNSRFSTLLGALIYSFAAYGLTLGLMHSCFMIPVAYFPFIILGIDKIFEKKSPFLFIFFTAISAASNFYFFYMQLILIICYAVFRYFRTYGRLKARDLLKTLGAFLLYGLNAFLIAAIMLLPVLSVMFSSERFKAEKSVEILYSIKYYLSFFADFATTVRPGAWTLMGFTSLSTLAVVILFVKREPSKKGLRIVFLVTTAFLLIPVCGFILNGFAYVTNRWTWAYAMVVAFTVASVYPGLFTLTDGEKKKIILVCMAVVCIGAASFLSRNEENLASEVFLLLLCCGLILTDFSRVKRERVQLAALVCLLIGFSLNALFHFSVRESNWTSEFLNFREANSLLLEKNPDSLLPPSGTGNNAFARGGNGGENDFYRLEELETDTTINSSIQRGVRGTRFYFSLTSPYVSEFLNKMYCNWPKDYDYSGVESRAGLEALASVKYVLAGDGGEKDIPYGFEKLVATGDTPAGHTDLYEAKNFLPLGYTYEGYIPKNEFDGMSVTERQNAMLSGAVLSESDFQAVEAVDDSRDALISITPKGDMDMTENSFTVRRNASVTLSINRVANAETYVILKNFSFRGFGPREAYDEGAWAGLTPYEQAIVRRDQKKESAESTTSLMVTEGENSKIIEYFAPWDDFYCGRKDFLVNLGYHGEGESSVRISFRNAGVYTFDSLEVRCQPLESVSEKIQRLSEDVLTDLNVGADKVTGRIQLDKPKILVLSIPYSKGWKATVDGQTQELKRANLMYMALELGQGEHEICLTYQTPYLQMGMVLTILGILMLCGILLVRRIWGRKITAV
ncbi:MAG: YfhO family protein [Lachnospiraceae bacterium]|nr:YfhO family protein [Lachnospiraceae bacterium]